MYGLRSETWNVGWIFRLAGRSRRYATGDITDVTVNGPVKRGRNLREGASVSAASLRFFVERRTLSPTSNCTSR